MTKAKIKKLTEPIVNNKAFILRGDSFLIAFCNYYDCKSGKILSRKLNTKNTRLSSDNFSYRIINHWENNGLISSSRAEEKGWRKYSILEVVWIYVIARLRQFGFPLDKILVVKNNLENPPMKNKPSQYPFFEFYVVNALVYRKPVYLLVFQDGQAEPVLHSEFIAAKKYFQLDNHINISINEILQKIYPNIELKPEYETSLELSDAEFDLMFMIRMQNYESIKVKTNDGRIELIEANEKQATDKRITQILKEKKYQDIEIKQQNGKVVHIKRTVKKKYDK